LQGLDALWCGLSSGHLCSIQLPGLASHNPHKHFQGCSEPKRCKIISKLQLCIRLNISN
jgi:hypothetical protein